MRNNAISMKPSPAAIAKGVISFDTNFTSCFVASNFKSEETSVFFLISTLTEMKLVMVVWPILHLCLMRFELLHLCHVCEYTFLEMI